MNTHVRNPRRRLRAFVALGVASWAVFAASVVKLPIEEHSLSTVGDRLYRWIYLDTGLRTRTTVYPNRASLVRYYIHTPEGFVNLFSDPRPTEHADSVVAYLDVQPGPPRGWWAPVAQTTWYRVTFDGTGGDPAEAARLRALFIDKLAAEGDPLVTPRQSDLRVKDVAASKAHWPGVIHNAISILSLGIGTACLIRLPCSVREHRHWRAGRCSRCGYDLSATPATAPCPECGTHNKPMPST